MHWQDKGDYLCLKIDRFTKTKKSTSPYFEIFFMKEKGIPIQGLEVKNKIIAFAWEPKGSRFVFIHAPDSTPRHDISFYGLEDGKIVHLKTLEKKQANHLFWSPRGEYIVLAGLKSPYNGVLEFYNANKLETFSTTEHYAASELEWDPSGRYVVTSSSSWSPTSYSSDSGYNMWTFFGKLLSKNMIEKFNQFMWRPRPPSILSEEQEKEIKSTLRATSQKFKEEENKRRDEALKERRVQRQKQKKEFEEYLARKKKELEEETKRREKEDEASNLYSIRRFERVIETRTEILD
jgi:translation initiation factor 3 subunit B